MIQIRWKRNLVLAAAIAVAFAAAAHANEVVPTTYHKDHRGTPKLQLAPAWQNANGHSGETMVRTFLADRSALYDLPTDLANLRLGSARESRLGTHFRFQQQIDGVDVRAGEIVVSVSKQDGRIYRVYNNTYPAKKDALQRDPNALTIESAYDIAWDHLRIHGDLVAPPNAKLVWLPEGADFRLGWVVNLTATAPRGSWEVTVDAVSGGVVSTRDLNLYRLKDEFVKTPVSERIGAYTGPARDRHEAFRSFGIKRSHLDRAPAGALVNGTGTVFDPDPRTTLQDDNIQDGDPPGTFTAAYFTRDLLDITENAGVYSLTGPWVDIIDFDPPSTPPSTTVDGNWTATRGDNSFNDAMTYFHLEQS
jgi:hypothetical protein